jgi:Putative zinc-finger
VTTPLPCGDVRSLAPELALGVLAGTERAATLQHLAGCDACRDVVADLARVADGLLLAAPTAEPPPGFESRVLERLAGERATAPVPIIARPRPRRRGLAVLAGSVAAAALLVLGAVAGWAASRPSPAQARYLAALDTVGGDGLLAAPMREADGVRVGEVFLFDGSPSWVFLSIDGWSSSWTDVRYAVRVDLVDGRQVVIDDVDLNQGDGAWGAVVDVDVADVRWVGVVDDGGAVYCGADLSEA